MITFESQINRDLYETEEKKAQVCSDIWNLLLVLLVDGILKFQTLLDYFGSYALVEISLILLVVLPTLAVYIFTKE